MKDRLAHINEIVDWSSLLDWAATVWLYTFVADSLRYLLAAGLVFLVLWVWLRRRLRGRRIQTGFPARGDMWREVRWSAATAATFATVGIGTTFLIQSGWTRFYPHMSDHGWGYWAFSLVAVIVLHDAYFYWTHRSMHHPALFRRFHKVHHLSTNPSPWAAYAFAPGEAASQALFVPLTLMVLPLHPLALFLFLVHMILRNALGHSGFEIFPRGAPRRPVWGRFTTTTHHDLHHSDNRGNFGLYFTWWDRLMGTEHPDYRETFDRVTARSTLTAPGRAIRPGHRAAETGATWDT